MGSIPEDKPDQQTNNSSMLLAVFKQHQAALKWFIGRYLHQPQDIEDVAQETFLRSFYPVQQ